MSITIWTQDGCALCERVKAALSGQEYEERDVAGLMDGSKADDDAMAQLMMQDMALPLVRVDGEWADPMRILAEADAAAA